MKKKYVVGINYEFKGDVTFEVMATDEADAERIALQMAEDKASDHLSCGNSRFDCDIEELYFNAI